MDHYHEQQIIRTVMALCALASQSVAVDVRDDMRDEAYLLVHACLRNSSASEGDGLEYTLSEIRKSCKRLVSRLEVIASDVLQPQNMVLVAYASVLRLQSALGSPEDAHHTQPASPASVPIKIIDQPSSPSSPKAFGGNHAKILNAIRTNPDIRTKELIEKFSQSLSDRTVKRCLKDLVTAGLLERSDKQENGAVLYRVALDPTK